MASFKQVTLKDPTTGDYLSPRVYGAIEYEVVEDGTVVPPYTNDADSLGGKPASDYVLDSELTEALAGKADATHTHEITQVTGLQDQLNGKANSSHTHTVSQITDMPDLTNAIPSGIICMWSGESTAIPSGWHLCDGSSGTPDLRDRFIVGAGSTYEVGNTGGSDSVTLSTSQIPSHTHSIGSHSHDIYIADQNYGSTSSGRYIGSSDSVATDSSSNLVRGRTETASGNTGSTGSGSSHENRPPYFALCFIMKL